MQGCKSNWLTHNVREILVHPSTPSTTQPSGYTDDSRQLTTAQTISFNFNLWKFQWKWTSHFSVKKFPIVRSSYLILPCISHTILTFWRARHHTIARVFFHFSLKLKTILFALTWWGSGRHSHLSTARWRTRRAALWWSAPASIDPACSYLGMPSSPALTASKIKPHKNTSHKLLAKGHAAF